MVSAGRERPATVHAVGGRIERVAAYDDLANEADVVDVGSLALLPGFVDSHVHINDPGRSEWEGFETATLAAAAGGVTTLVDMPLNSVPPVTTVNALEQKLRAAEGQLSVDVAFWGGVVPGNVSELRPLYDAGVAGFKCFLAPSGVSEFPHVSNAGMEEALAILATFDAPLLVHAEDPALLAGADPAGDPRRYVTYLATRPPEAELAAVRAVIAAAARTGGRAHIVHVSAVASLDEITAARQRGIRVTAETCPHYLWFAAESIPDGGTMWKCAPPIRDSAERAGLQAALRRGAIDLVASDHSPAPPELKQASGGDFITAWGGISSLQLAPLVTWTVAAEMGCSLAQLCNWIAAAPARLAGLDRVKGEIAPGMDADLVAFDPDGTTTIDSAAIHHRHRTTPYEGIVLRGRVLHTWLRGELVYDGGIFPSSRSGRTLLGERP